MRNTLSRKLLVLLTIITVVIAMSFQANMIFVNADTGSAPTWKTGAVKTEEVTVTKGNPFTPTQYLSSKWSDTGSSDLTYYYSVNNGEKQSCADYMGAEDQARYFAYTPESTGDYTIKIWANNGKLDSEKFTATVHVVDPDTYEYPMTIKVGPSTDNVKFYKCAGFDDNGFDKLGDEVTATDTGVASDGTHTYTMKLKKGSYSFRGTDKDGNSLGGMTFSVPNVAKTAGSSETNVFLNEVNVFCRTQYKGSYCTADQFTPEIRHSGQKVTMGSTLTDAQGKAGYRCMVVAAGNDYIYQTEMDPSKTLDTEGFGNGWVGTTVTFWKAKTAQVVVGSLTEKANTVINAPEGASVSVYFQRNYYNTINKDNTLVSKETQSDGTVNWTFALPSGNNGYTYRVTKSGSITKAGYLDGKKSINVAFGSNEDPASQSNDGDSASLAKRNENSILLNVNSRNDLQMQVGDTFNLRAYRAAWEIVNSDTGNIIIEPDFHANILSGSDIVGIKSGNSGNGTGNSMNITAKKAGTAIVEVTYDAIDIGGNTEYTGRYGASSSNRKGLVIIQVGNSGSSTIKFGIEGSNGKVKKWDSEFDTVYFFGKSGTVKMKPSVTGSTISKVEVNNAPSSDTWTEISGNNGEYTVPVADGNNIVRITAADGTVSYQLVRGAKASYTVTNETDPGKDPAVGDKLKIHIDGLYMPVPKMSGVYNPGYMGTAKVQYSSSIDGKVGSSGTQYDFITNHDFYVTLKGYNGGKYTLSNGNITTSVFGNPNCLGDHRTITDAGLSTMFNAVSTAWTGSTIEDIDIDIASTDYVVDFENMLSGSKLTLKNASGTIIDPADSKDDSVSYTNLPEGTYTYTVTKDGYKDLEDTVTVSASGNKTQNIYLKQSKDKAVEFSNLVKDSKVTLTRVDSASTSKVDVISNTDTTSTFNLPSYGMYLYNITKDGYKEVNGYLNVNSDSDQMQTVSVSQETLDSTSWDGKTLTEPSKDSNDVYQISNGAELAWFGKKCYEDGSISADLTKNIDMGGFAFSPIGWNTEDQAGNQFRGKFDGNGYSISGLFIHGADSVDSAINNAGFFNEINKGTVSNLTIDGLMFVNRTPYCGGISSDNYDGTITGCTNNMNIICVGIKDTSDTWLGGIVGQTSGTVTRCVNNAQIYGMELDDKIALNTGGIVGECLDNAIVSDSYNTGVINGNRVTGGIIGNISGSTTIKNCYNIGKINASNVAGSAIGDATNNAGTATNVFCLEGTASNTYNSSSSLTITGISFKTSSELKDAAETLGSSFRKAYSDENSGYPVLSRSGDAAWNKVKSDAIDAITNYKDASLYRNAEKKELAKIIKNANAEIRKVSENNEDGIKDIVSSAKAEIDKLKTNAEWSQYELSKEQNAAIISLNSYLKNTYSAEDQTKVNELIADALASIDQAKTIKEVDSILSSTKNTLDSYKPQQNGNTGSNGTSTNSNTEIEAAKALMNAKLLGQAQIMSYLSNDYSSDNKAQVTEIVNTTVKSINSANTVEAVKTIVNQAKVKLDKIATKDNSFVIDSSSSRGGNISSADISINKGSSQTIKITPNKGYKLSYLIVDGETIDGSRDSYTFSNVTSNHVIYAQFEKKTYKITASKKGKGSITATGSVKYNDTKIIKIKAAKGYKLSKLYVDGKKVKNVKKYTFRHVNKKHSIKAVFVIK